MSENTVIEPIKEKVACQSPTVYYAALLPALTKAARACGYAIGLHGSMIRDLDLIAVPWTEEAVSPPELIQALVIASGGELKHPVHREIILQHCGEIRQSPTEKPHGRLAYSIYLRGNDENTIPYIDVSVMPRILVQPEKKE